jgi:hypothetical protein
MSNTSLSQYPSVQIGTSSLEPVSANNMYMYPFEETDTFNQSIFRKKEFYNNRLERSVEVIEPRTLLRHQKTIANFFSARTMFDRLLVVHLMGTGKTCVSIAAVERLLDDPLSTIKKAVILTKNDLLVDQFIRSVMSICTPNGKYADRRSVRSRYRVLTYYTFARDIRNLNQDQLIKQYSNCVFVVDEIHTIALNAKSDDRVYNYLHKVFHTCENIKVMLMSGTPIRDDVSEIAYIMNLLLPMSKQIDPATFESEYFDPKTGNVRKEIVDEKFRPLIEGKVSYLLPPENEKYRYLMNERTCPENKLREIGVFYDTYCSTLSPKQYESYLVAYEQDSKSTDTENKRTSGFYSNSRQAMLCVDPDGNYGRRLNAKSVIQYINRGRNTAELRTMSADERFAFRISNLRDLSCKYATAIELIRRARSERKSVWVFCNLVQSSGINMFVRILKVFEFESFSPTSELTTTSSTDRFINTSDAKLSDLDRLKMINAFNSPENMHGEMVRVIIGSPALAEGVSLRNVQQVQILTPYWNFTMIEQAIYRCLRYDSYRAFETAGESYMCDIYLHMGNYDDTRIDSIDTNVDVLMYRTSYAKDRKIKQIESVLKTSAFDCALNYKRNVRLSAKENSRECLYSECANYTCHGFAGPKEYLSAPEFEMSTFLENQSQFYYRNNEIIKIVKSMFVRKFEIGFVEIRETVNARRSESETQYTDLEIVDALRHMIYDRVQMVDRHRFACFLNERDNVYFLTADMTTDPTCNDGFYSEFPVVSTRVEFSDVLTKMYIDRFASDPGLYAMNNSDFDAWFGSAPDSVKKYFSSGDAGTSEAERAFAARVRSKYTSSVSSDINIDEYLAIIAPRIKQANLENKFVDYTYGVDNPQRKFYYPTLVLTKEGKTYSMVVDSDTNSKILGDVLTDRRKIPSGVQLNKMQMAELYAISSKLGVVLDNSRKITKNVIVEEINKSVSEDRLRFGKMPGEDEYIAVPSSKIT